MSFFSPKPKLMQIPVEEPPMKVPVPMPNVFVVPPEEDQTPPWCFFHAENPELSQIDERSESPDNSTFFEVNGDSPPSVFTGGSMIEPMPSRNRETISIVDALLGNRDEGDDSGSEASFEGEMDVGEDEEHNDSNSIQENDRHGLSRDQEREPADDSDVIEVVKVSRRKSLAEIRKDDQSVRAFSEFKRSGTIKSRASKVFRSLRGTLRSKPRAQDIFNPPAVPTRASQQTRESEPSEGEAIPRPKTPTITRRGSRVLSQLFTGPSIKPRSSISSFNEQTPVSDEVERSQSPPPTSPQSSHFGSVPLSRRTSLYTLGTQHNGSRLRAASPTPTTISSKTTNRRRSFSILRLFSFSSSSSSCTSSAPAPSLKSVSTSYDEPGRATPTQHSNSSTPSATSSISTVSSPQPRTPTSTEASPVRLVAKEEPIEPLMFGNFDSIFDTNADLNLGLGLSLDGLNESTISSRHSTTAKHEQASGQSSSRTGRQSYEDPGDTSIEMRLDSFHFDDLSFDVSRF
ncbi:hypothetical protein JR316_0003253 [Psilocybe cubensis]|uniref:Uncharacterized protein n=2 Tax=Psilocybe cubensis TaxID=181762 RepID=A0A8H7Y2D0_PSICU|nr:hypothetical protein JR316_0003253 [Psilocybe cubensis]KAH9483777.1 hypothetical protein JR316_0003253 [Psilocybe cubensis]